MPDENSGASSAASTAPEAQTADAKSGNITVDGARARLLSRMAETAERASAAVKPAGDNAAPAQAGETPAAQAAPTQERTESTPAETASAETQQSEIDAAAASDLSQLSSLDPSTRELVNKLLDAQKDRIQSAVDKRIAKEVAKRGELQRQLQSGGQQQQTQATAAQQAQPFQGLIAPIAPPAQAQPLPAQPALADQPLAHISDFVALDKEERMLKSMNGLADDALTDGPNESGKYVVDGAEFTKAQLIQIRRNTNNILQNSVPERRTFIQIRQQSLALAVQEFPWMKDPSTPEYQQAQHALNTQPWLRGLPNAEVLIGVNIEGLKAIAARKAASSETAKKGATQTTKPRGDLSILGGGGSGAIRNPEAARAAKKSETRELRKSGGMSVRDVARYLGATSRT